MKKNILFLIGLAVSLNVVCFGTESLFSLSTVLAQTFDSTKAYQDYQYSLDVYNQANSSFEDAKDFYNTNKTLTLKEDARKKLLIMLKDRDQLISVYLTALRIKILETKGVADGDKNDIFGKIDNEVDWYKDHSNRYADGDSTEDLFTKSTEAETRYKSTTIQIVYSSLFTISLGEETGMRQDYESIYSDLKSIISTGVSAGKLNANPFNRWFTDIDSTIQTLKQNEALAKTEANKIYSTQSYNQSLDSSSYDSSVTVLSSSVSSLTQLSNFLTEVLTSIKNQQ